ncbi:MAG: glycosyltransferase [Anaerolineae bacterium]
MTTHSQATDPIASNIKRIALLSVHTCPLAMMGGKKTGGMNVYVRDIARELGRQGFIVDVFTRSEDDCQPQIKHDLGFGARVIHIKAGPEVPVRPPEIIAHIGEFVEGMLAFADDENAEYDLIHSHYWLSGMVAESLKKAWEAKYQKRIPVVQMFHTLGHMKNKINPRPEERAPQSRIDGESHIIQNIADLITSPTVAEVQQLQELYGADKNKISIVPPGVDLNRFKPLDPQAAKEKIGVDPDGFNIMFVGRIEPLKGIDTFIEAASILRQHHPEEMKNVHFTIVGGDPWDENPATEMGRLQALHKELNVEDIVGFVGAKNQNELPTYYAAADVVVMPSHYESFGMVALEAMAMGTPVIASEVGGLAHLVQDGKTGFHIPPRSADALATRLCDLLFNPILSEKLGRQAREHALTYDWRLIAGRLITAFDQVSS